MMNMVREYKTTEEIISLGEEKGLLKVNENKVEYVSIGKAYKITDPEELVRASYYTELITKYKYPKTRIALEEVVPRREPKDKADIIVYEDDEKKPYIVVECKKDGISQSEIKQAVEQAEIEINRHNQGTYSSNYYDATNHSQDNEFYFQWHITDRCNLRCSHCYQNDYSHSSELSLEELKSVADKISHTLTVWKKDGRVAITGGEPFVRKDLFDLLHYLEQQPTIKKIGILTNGTLLKGYVNSLKDITKIYYIQMSIEGRREKNDEIRGKGVFDKVIENTNLLKKNNIPVRWMVTLYKWNVNDTPYIIDLALENNVDVLTFERLIPTGTGKSMKDPLLAPNDLSKVYKYIVERSDEEYSKGSSLTILKFRTLWVLTDPKRAKMDAYTPLQKEVGAACSIGIDSLCILPDATVLPCRRLPIPIGNLKKDSIFKIWYTSDLLWKIRNKSNLRGKCTDCEFVPRCGGCRAMAYAVTGDYLAEDPQCWKAE